MEEVKHHLAYQLIEKLKSRSDMVIDFVILQNDKPQHDIRAHKQAAINGINVISKRYKKKCQTAFTIIEDKMHGVPYPVELLLEDKLIGKYIHAFLEPPYGSTLTKEDFHHINNMLFSAYENLEIYDWCAGVDWNTTDGPEVYWQNKWSDYFENGLEWWGVLFWTIYDMATDFFIIIAASATD